MTKMNMKYENHMMPFLWVHGEEKDTYVELVKAIKKANIDCFCVESRPHEDFLQDKWWEDLEIIIEEAKKNNMSFYILDDKHFPTGFANGAILKAPNKLRRQSIFYKNIKVKKGDKVKINIKDYAILEPTCTPLGKFMMDLMNKDSEKFDDDSLLSASYFNNDSIIDLKDKIANDILEFNADTDGNICLCFLTRNAGIHRNYINMLEKESVKYLIDEVYEKHYDHFKDEFGKTIVGFFSDEPEIGNSTYTNREVDMGKDPNLDLCWSISLEKMLEEKIGSNYKKYMPLLWFNDFNKDITSKIRYIYMSCVTDLVSDAFSKQIGDWCVAHNVEYIGHVIEDNNLHTKTCSSLGHYFKGLKYQTMAGIDDIGGQVLPMLEDQIVDNPPLAYRNGLFYHYTLAKLGVSLATINPRMNNRTMCEIFGNYGWEEGVKLEKYLLDHFMVRGVNYFVPHAFSAKAYPDPDCPPHFYAFNNNPLYRHFGKLMEYGNRVCSLTSANTLNSKIAILYYAESEWCGEAHDLDELSKILFDAKINYTYIPQEVFVDPLYNINLDNNITINNHEFDYLIINECDRIPPTINILIDTYPDKVIFINRLPYGTCDNTPLSKNLNKCEVISLNNIAKKLDNYKEISISPFERRIRAAYYYGNDNFYFLVNENNTIYEGKITINEECDVTLYDAFLNKYIEAEYFKKEGKTTISITLNPTSSIFIFKDIIKAENNYKLEYIKDINDFDVKACRSIDYPNFKEMDINNGFSGLVSYEKEIKLTNNNVLMIDDAYEGVEVFINNKSLGIQIISPYKYDLSAYNNQTIKLKIEVATTLYNERINDLSMAEMYFNVKEEKKIKPVGIIGKVRLLKKV